MTSSPRFSLLGPSQHPPWIWTEFVVVTQFGPRTVGSFEELLAALDVVGEPCEFPLADWPGVTGSVIA